MDRFLLNFGAANWETEVYINGHLVGSHRGGYDPFTFDISAALTGGSAQNIVVRVSNPADGQIPRGKQSRLLKLERILGQPPETASIIFELSRSDSCVTRRICCSLVFPFQLVACQADEPAMA
jgi:hypothetical protein